MRKKLVILLIIPIVMIIGFLAISYIYLNANKDDLKEQAIEQVNKHLSSPIQVKGGLDFSVLKNFPLVSLELNQVLIPDPLRKDVSLLIAERVYLSANIISIVKGNYTIDKLFVKNAVLDLYTNGRNQNNYDILKENDSEQSTSIELTELTIDNCQVIYSNIFNDVSFKTKIDEASFETFFQGPITKLNADISTQLDSVKIESDIYAVNDLLESSIELTLIKDSLIQIINSTLEFDELATKGKFNYILNKKTDKHDLKVNVNTNNSDRLLASLPVSLKDGMNVESIHGKSAIGIYFQKDLSIDFELYKADIKLPQLKIPFENASLIGSYSAVGNGSLTLKDMAFQGFDGEASVTINDLKNIKAAISLSGKIDMKDVYKYMGLDKDSIGIYGNFELLDASVTIDKVKQDVIIRDLSGEVVFNDFEVEAAEFIIDEHKVNIHENAGIVNDLQFELMGNDLTYSGKIYNLNEFLNGLINSKEQYLGLKGNLKCEELEFKSNSNTELADQVDLRWLKAELNLDIDEFTNSDLVLENVLAETDIYNNSIYIRSINAQLMEGSMEGKGHIRFLNDKTEVSFSSKSRNINIEELFDQMNDFNQETLTADNLEGTLDAEFDLNIDLDINGEPRKESLKAQFYLEVTDGKLLNFKPMEGMSKYVDLKELRKIEFGKMSNLFSIDNSVLTMPSMKINSSILSLEAQGKYIFDGRVDFDFIMNLREVLAKKFQKKKKEGYYYENEKGFVEISMKMTGTVDEPEFKLKKVSAKKMIREELKGEGEELKSIFKKEPEKKEDLKKTEEKYFNLDDETEYIEWEDSLEMR